MRINLQCPFRDKDLAKQRGARWDPRLRVWYIEDVADLAPFAAWLPASADVRQASPVRTGSAPRSGSNELTASGKPLLTTGPARDALRPCTCLALPWEDCTCPSAA
jgi:hypothetical protein